ncbi:MAG TPA: SAM-dependent methyltransferase [Micromonosporaceae bacterium]
MNQEEPKHATAARIYDYLLGGTHNFPADREVAQVVLASFPTGQAGIRANRAFLRRAVRFLAESGVRQFLDVGSGIPTVGNVHEIAQSVTPDARVVYVDIDPVAVAESLEILDGNPYATAVMANLLEPDKILDHPQVREVLDFDQPIALLLVALLHFVAEDADAYGSVARLASALPKGSYLVLSHASSDAHGFEAQGVRDVEEAYRKQTTATGRMRSREEISRFFDGLEMIDPGLAWVSQWRPDPAQPPEFDDPGLSMNLAGVARVP